MHDRDYTPVEDVIKVARSRLQYDCQQVLISSQLFSTELFSGGGHTYAWSRWLRLVPAVLRLLKAR